MKLYIFRIKIWGANPKFEIEEVDAEEKPKTYIYRNDSGWKNRISKSMIGVYNRGVLCDECILLENDLSKAAGIILKQKEKELEEINGQLNKKSYERDLIKKYIN